MRLLELKLKFGDKPKKKLKRGISFGVNAILVCALEETHLLERRTYICMHTH